MKIPGFITFSVIPIFPPVLRRRSFSSTGVRYESGCLQCPFRAVFHALHAKDALRAVFSLSWIVSNIDIHRTNPFALSTWNTFFLVAFYAHDGKITHRFKKNRDRTNVFTERAIIFKSICKDDSDRIVQHIPDNKGPKYNSLNIPDMCQKQSSDKNQWKCKGYISDPSDLFSWLCRHFTLLGAAGSVAAASAIRRLSATWDRKSTRLNSSHSV